MYYHRNWLGGLRKATKELNQDTGLRSEIWNRDFQNTKQVSSHTSTQFDPYRRN
jgi:hypothetical protein